MLKLEDASFQHQSVEFGALTVGQVFMWKTPRDCGAVLCVKLKKYDCNGTTFCWTPLKGPEQGIIYEASIFDEVTV